jgi:hypothetical protein
MKARDATRVSVLRGVIAAIKNARVEHRGAAVTEDQIVALVRREVKQRHEVVELARQGGRRDVLEQTERELAILDSLLPAVLTPEELDAAVRGLYAAGATSIGEIMRGLQAGYPGRVDGKAASTVARRVLAGSN